MDSNKNENWREILSRIEEKIDLLENKVEAINHRVNPPWWKNIAGFIANNFFTILTLISLFLIAWKALAFYQDITSQIESVKSLPSNAFDSMKDLPQSAGDSIKDLIKNISF